MPYIWYLTVSMLPTLAFGALVGCTKEYHPSPLELRWYGNISAWQTNDRDWGPACKAWAQDNEAGYWDTWMESIKNYTHHGQAMPEHIFSYHKVQCEGLKPRKLYLEPLSVALRTPKFPCGGTGNEFIFDTAWLTFPFAADTPHRRAYFFDLGSTYYDAGVAGYADSLAWFMDSFKKRGWKFDQVFAWEIRHVDHNAYWKRVPDEMKHKMHFFNTACSENPDSGMNPLKFIRAVAKPEDFVVLKVDIDNTPVEVSIIMQILQSAEAMLLIDEIFWENHVTFSPTQWVGWGNLSAQTGPSSTLDGSYETFMKLRKGGIRAHSWV